MSKNADFSVSGPDQDLSRHPAVDVDLSEIGERTVEKGRKPAAAKALTPDWHTPINILPPVHRRLFPRLFDGLPTYDIQVAYDNALLWDQAFSKILVKGTTTLESEKKVIPGKVIDMEIVSKDTQSFRFRTDNGLIGTDDNSSPPVTYRDAAEDVERHAAEVGDVIVVEAVNVYTDPRILALCEGEPSRLFDPILRMGDQAGVFADRGGFESDAVHEQLKEMLAENGNYDETNQESVDWLSDKVQGYHVSLGPFTDTGETYVRMFERGVLHEIYDRMRGGIPYRDVAEPKLHFDASGNVSGVQYELPRYDLEPFL
jgi:hypothetical protein